ncbi:hypothetical protein [Streptomyces sp. STCH 565 A]|uniref:hypothetical protein n=1 Tax=Streptomyces sp. STCH 565 A TaxID=2950532 RepID=UPI0020754DF6|nr:hypothetical protein [Streptomyces sp. STCH 565 A]MCM8555476.1 hypothetical protein [Streptomyces sp. STCH 565 A]
MGEELLDETVARVLEVWAAMAARGEMSPQTLSRFSQLLDRFVRFARARGAVELGAVTPGIAAMFVDAHGHTRQALVAPAAPATRHLRRSVLRMFYTTARELGLTDTDPTYGLELPPRTTGGTRPLSEDEAVALRHASEFTERPTRHAAAAALALAGGFSGEIGHVGPRHLDVARARVWLHGSTKTTPRWCPLDTWGLRVLTARSEHVHAAANSLYPQEALRLAVSPRTGNDEQIQARVCVALRDLLKAIGLGADKRVRPASVTAYAGAEALAATGRIEAAACLLGMSSLDSTAALIGHDWRTADTEETTPKDGKPEEVRHAR